MLPDLFFILGSSFILGTFIKHFFNIFYLLNFLLAFLFFLKTKKLKISLLVLLFLFAGSIFYDLKSQLAIKLEPPKFITNYRQIIEEKIKSYLPYPYENIFRGILFGSKFEDPNLKENFVNSGLIHLTAVSGQNLTIMFSIFYNALKYIPFLTPNLLFIISIFIIIFFIFLMGFEGSVLRAGIMGFFLILAKRKFGRIILRRNLLLLTALIFTLIDPKLLIENIGTQLSFLAFTGILYLAPILERKIPKIFSEVLAAQIFTLPLILYYFGTFNLFSVLANILVLPLIPTLMQLMTIFLFFPVKYLSYLSLPLLFYINFVSEIFSQIGFFYFKIPLIAVFLIYAFIFVEIYFRLKDETIDFRLNLN